MNPTPFTLKTNIDDVEQTDFVARFETFVSGRRVDFVDDANGFVADGDGASQGIWAERHHQVGMAEGGGGDFDEELGVGWFGNGD